MDHYFSYASTMEDDHRFILVNQIGKPKLNNNNKVVDSNDNSRFMFKSLDFQHPLKVISSYRSLHQKLSMTLLILCVSTVSCLKAGDTCVANTCDLGLLCKACVANNNNSPRCINIQPISPFSKANDLPFNKYSWLTTHNSFARPGLSSATGDASLANTNQENSITSQLQDGVRGFTLDMYDFEDDVWLCNSSGGKCFTYTAFEPAINALREIGSFLETRQSEIITIFIDDYVLVPNALPKLFEDAGLRKFWFPASQMPKNGEDWPTVNHMILKNQRLVVFGSQPSKEALEGIAYQWNYVVENQFGDGGMVTGFCPNRPESSFMNATSSSLVLINYYPDKISKFAACSYNSDPLMNMLSTCHDFSAGRWANFVVVDFYQRSDGGGAPAAVNMINGQLVCGSTSIDKCKMVNGFASAIQPRLWWKFASSFLLLLI